VEDTLHLTFTETADQNLNVTGKGHNTFGFFIVRGNGKYIVVNEEDSELVSIKLERVYCDQADLQKLLSEDTSDIKYLQVDKNVANRTNGSRESDKD